VLGKAMRWRLIGPFRGGRVTAVAGHPQDPLVFYFGACNGGIWRTDNAGATWRNVSDGYVRSASVGALAVSPSHPHVLYAGMGEACIRSNVSHGDGVYRSDDGGRTWRWLGLEDTRHIARVRVDPYDPDRVYVAALGHAFGPNRQRGIFRSLDGGRTWQHVLFVDEDTGACDLSLDPLRPHVLYAALWRGRRLPHALESGSETGGLWRSLDGGDTWERLSGRGGFPGGLVGRLGVSASPAQEGRVYAVVEADKGRGGVYRSDDGGEHWERVCEEPALLQRPWYYQHIFAHPTEPDTVYVLNVEAWRSTDGGRTFQGVPAPHGDHHDLWIDPQRPWRMIEGNDGGAMVSLDAGRTWSTLMNQPTAQFYHVTTDRTYPYRVYGAQQDNTTLCGPSRSHRPAISNAEWHSVGGGESGYIAVRPDNPDIVYAGNYMYLSRFDRKTGQARNILPWPESTLGQGAGEARYRFQWTFPILVSPHDPSVLYVAANVVFRSQDEGQTWEVISPDLTRNDPQRLSSSGGPITKDNTAAEYYCTIFALAESPVEKGRLWAGTDDGRVHVSPDGGRTWVEVTPPEDLLPPWTLVSMLEPSPHDPQVVYLAATRAKLDDLRPILLRTRDGGHTWQPIVEGIPADEPTRAVRADPVRPGLLYAGTERGVYVSLDDGDHWEPLGTGLPVVPVHDLAVHEDDLVAATHGRSFWILDDISPLRQVTEATQRASVHLFTPRPTVRGEPWWGWTSKEGHHGYVHMDNALATWERPYGEEDGAEPSPRMLDAGENPPAGVILTYRLDEAAAQRRVVLRIRDAHGHVVRTYTSDEPPSSPRTDEEAWQREPRLPATPGYHRFVWDMRYPGPGPLPRGVFWSGSRRGPWAPPGKYEAELEAGDLTVRVPVHVILDPRVTTPPEDLEAQFALSWRIVRTLSQVHEAVRAIHAARSQAQGWRERVRGAPHEAAVARACDALEEALAPIEDRLFAAKARHRDDLLHFPMRLSEKLDALLQALQRSDNRPTQAMEEVYRHLDSQVRQERQTLRQVLKERLAALEDALRQAGLPLVGVALSEEGEEKAGEG
jgi:photosystem II stability/assembly factor-like uncharacterized protein